MEDVTDTKEPTNGMLIPDDTQNLLPNHSGSSQHPGGGVGAQGLLQHPMRLGGAEAQYLEGLLREQESLGSTQGMDLAKRLISQGEWEGGRVG